MAVCVMLRDYHVEIFSTLDIVFYFATRRIFAFTRALCLGETLVLLDVVSQGFIL